MTGKNFHAPKTREIWINNDDIFIKDCAEFSTDGFCMEINCSECSRRPAAEGTDIIAAEEGRRRQRNIKSEDDVEIEDEILRRREICIKVEENRMRREDDRKVEDREQDIRGEESKNPVKKDGKGEEANGGDNIKIGGETKKGEETRVGEELKIVEVSKIEEE